jgi:hypothetical protein
VRVAGVFVLAACVLAAFPAVVRHPGGKGGESARHLAGAPSARALARTAPAPGAGSRTIDRIVASRVTSAGKPNPSALAPAPSATPARAGMVVAIDPETGKLGMPNEEQMRRLTESERARLATPSVDWLPEVHHPDGSVTVDVGDRFPVFETVRIGSDGKKTFRCVSDTTAATGNGVGPIATPQPPHAEER